MAPTTLAQDPRVKRLAKICSSLREVESRVHTDFIDYRVRTKLFAYFLFGHDPDGITSICVKCDPGENVNRASSDPDLYYLPPYIGKKGWFGIRVDRAAIDWKDIEEAVRHSYRLAAPRSLSKPLDPAD